MKFKSKRIVAIVLGMVMVLSILAGCGNGSGSTPETTKAPENAAQTQTEGKTEVQPADPLGKYEEEITLRGAFLSGSDVTYIPGNPDYDSAEKNMWISAYKDMLGINVTYDWVSADWDAYSTKWNLAMAQGKLPDFGMVDAAAYSMLLDADLVMDMTDIFEEYASDTYKAYLEADGGVTREFSTRNGRLMGLPLTGKQPDSVSTFWIRQDWLDELDMEVPTTIDELVEVAQAFVDNKMGGSDTYGLAISNSIKDPNHSVVGFLEGYGAALEKWVVDDTTGKLVYSSVMDNVKAPLLKLQEMYANGLINQDFAVSDSGITGEDVAAGKVGIVFGSYYAPTGTDTCMKNDSEAKWTVAEVPTADGSDPVVHADTSVTTFIFVNKNCEHPEAVVKLINLQLALYNDEDPDVVAKYTSHPSPADESQKIQTSKYISTVFPANRPWQNLTRHQEAVHALETGEENFSLALSQTTYTALQNYLNGDAGQTFAWLTFGPEGAFSVISNYKDDDRIVSNEYQTMKTETMTEKQDILDDALEGAMMKVIMGEDISTFEKAVEDWYKNGGQTMTDEANAWYEAK